MVAPSVVHGDCPSISEGKVGGLEFGGELGGVREAYQRCLSKAVPD